MVLACTTTTYMLLYPVLDQGGTLGTYYCGSYLIVCCPLGLMLFCLVL